MANTTLRKAVKKMGEVFSQNEDDDKPIVYFIDESVLRDWDRRYNPILEAGSKFLRTWNRITKYPIQEIAKFEYAWRKPGELYREIYKEINEKKFQQFAGLDIDITTLIRLPQDFDTVITDAEDFNKKVQRGIQEWRADYFLIEGEELMLSDAAYERRNRKAYYEARTPEQKRNLAIAEGIRDAIEKLAELVPTHKKIGAMALAEKRYVHPLPYQLKLYHTKSGQQLVPNPTFVKNGFQGTTILGFDWLTDEEKRRAEKDNAPKLGKKMKKLQIIDASGFPTGDYVLCEEKDLEKHAFGPFRVHRNIVLDGWYNEQGRPYGEPLKPDNILNPTSYTEKVINSLIQK